MSCYLTAGLVSLGPEKQDLDQDIREAAANLVDDVIFRAKEMAQRCQYDHNSTERSLLLLFLLSILITFGRLQYRSQFHNFQAHT